MRVRVWEQPGQAMARPGLGLPPILEYYYFLETSALPAAFRFGLVAQNTCHELKYYSTKHLAQLNLTRGILLRCHSVWTRWR